MAELLYAEDATSRGAWRAVGLGTAALVLLALVVADGGLVGRLVGGAVLAAVLGGLALLQATFPPGPAAALGSSSWTTRS